MRCLSLSLSLCANLWRENWLPLGAGGLWVAEAIRIPGFIHGKPKCRRGIYVKAPQFTWLLLHADATLYIQERDFLIPLSNAVHYLLKYKICIVILILIPYGLCTAHVEYMHTFNLWMARQAPCVAVGRACAWHYLSVSSTDGMCRHCYRSGMVYFTNIIRPIRFCIVYICVNIIVGINLVLRDGWLGCDREYERATKWHPVALCINFASALYKYKWVNATKLFHQGCLKGIYN